MTNDPFVSILIPVKADNKNLRECIEKCLALDYAAFEIIVLPDEAIQVSYTEKVKIIPTGPVGPAAKRDIAVDKARGDVLAFLDDDTFPDKDWLKNAAADLKNDVAAVGGPAVTPESDNVLQKASGLVYSLFLVSGPHNRRYIPRPKAEVDDYPSCNFLVTKEAFLKAGSFDTKFWPGEDTILCLKITNELKKKIIYNPQVLVCHHRRPLFGPHLRQIKSYALHRGYFVKKFPANSLKVSYFVPSVFVLGLIGGLVFSYFIPLVKGVYIVIVVFYLALAAFSSIPQKGFKLKALVFAGIILTHLAYGIYFIKGLFSKKLSEE
ncbi:MAG: glycosyltransferase [Candidatus Omnitrophica bacterium]|nr:glycosyltransferase [Candidatus Omnitrophota bacterium]